MYCKDAKQSELPFHDRIEHGNDNIKSPNIDTVHESFVESTYLGIQTALLQNLNRISYFCFACLAPGHYPNHRRLIANWEQASEIWFKMK